MKKSRSVSVSYSVITIYLCFTYVRVCQLLLVRGK